MDPLEDPWFESPSGSGAQDSWIIEDQQFDTFTADVNTSASNEDGNDDFTFSAAVFGAHELAPGQPYSTKVAPSFNLS